MNKPLWIGWHRAVGRGASWVQACEAGSEAQCLARLERVAPPVAGRRRVMMVLRQGENPTTFLRQQRAPKVLLGDRRSTRRRRQPRRGDDPLEDVRPAYKGFTRL
jgi:hypothetical protein